MNRAHLQSQSQVQVYVRIHLRRWHIFVQHILDGTIPPVPATPALSRAALDGQFDSW
ncbi:hypothetical protein FIBSPDRAFT_866155 [Athelia psychrophila]|uniref:Uncharacterized protein n=1 Tax=Athelia psychrophila TaxID=1759441 RepID=A0A166EVT1_9AGAM|nr:hypothetical protein FIBSPDRAFT_866155 [Fibularhizoctonia sp. CBS 109695]